MPLIIIDHAVSTIRHDLALYYSSAQLAFCSPQSLLGRNMDMVVRFEIVITSTASYYSFSPGQSIDINYLMYAPKIYNLHVDGIGRQNLSSTAPKAARKSSEGSVLLFAR